MNVFVATCKDTKTGLFLLAMNASYNNACCYLFNTYGTPAEVRTFTPVYTVIKYPSRAFTYDEARGYLLEGDITV